jgi:hypothetical protein
MRDLDAVFQRRIDKEARWRTWEGAGDARAKVRSLFSRPAMAILEAIKEQITCRDLHSTPSSSVGQRTVAFPFTDPAGNF